MGNSCLSVKSENQFIETQQLQKQNSKKEKQTQIKSEKDLKMQKKIDQEEDELSEVSSISKETATSDIQDLLQKFDQLTPKYHVSMQYIKLRMKAKFQQNSSENPAPIIQKSLSKSTIIQKREKMKRYIEYEQSSLVKGIRKKALRPANSM